MAEDRLRPQVDALRFLAGGGEMGALMRAHDWSSTGLGAPENWPQPLRTAVRLILNTGHPMYIWWGPELFCFYNDAYRKSIGPERHPASLGRPAREVWAEIWPIIGPQIDQVMSGRGATWHQDHLVPITRHGRREDVYWTYSYSPIDDDTAPQGVGGVLVVCSETTEQVAAHHQLQSELDRLSGLFDQAPSFMAVLRGPQHRFELANARYFDLVGHRPVIGQTVAEALPGAVAQGYLDLLDRVYRSGEAFAAHESKYVVEAEPGRPTDERFLDFVYQPIKDGRGNVIGIFVEGIDVTEHKHAKAALEKINASLEQRVAERTAELQNIQSFYTHSSECHAVLAERADGRFQYDEINPATLRLYGMTREQVIGRTVDELFDADRAAELTAQLAEGLRRDEPYRYLRKQGNATVEAIATRIPAEPGQPRRLAVTARDITERQQLEEQLHQAQKMEAIGQLTGGIAHDFNNMLAIIMGSLDLARRRAEQGSTNIQTYLASASEGTKRAAELVRRLLAFSRQQPLAPEIVDANRLVRNMSEILRRTLGEQIEIEAVLGAGLWLTLVDPHQLESAILNLAVNARDAMPDGGKLTIETANSYLDESYVASTLGVRAGQYIVIAVTDTGCGMPPEHVAKAFDPFFTTKEVGKGTGLGLSQVYGFVRQSDGDVKIYSEIGRGTTVKLYLHRHKGAPAATAVTSDPGIKQLPLGSPDEVILVVEDDELVRRMSVSVLRELGYAVHEAASGEQALQILSALPKVDLLFTDMVMPTMTGRQLADRAAARWPQLKVLYTTGYARNAVVHDGTLDANVVFLTKPFSVIDLATRVRHALDSSVVGPAPPAPNA